MNVTIDLSCGVSGDMVLAALLQMAFSRMPGDDHLRKLRAAGSVMSPTEVDLREEPRGNGMALSLGTRWKPLDGRSIKASDMSVYLEAALGSMCANERVGKRARSMLNNLLGAEMSVHSVRDPNDLHLHETGTPDTLVDIVGCSYLFDRLELDGDWIRATPVSLGRGMVSNEHGVFDVPAPAVRHLLRGVPAVEGPVEGELATPTGMAVVVSLVDEWCGPRDVNGPNKGNVVGRGAGSRTVPGFPDVLEIWEGP